MVSHYHQCVRTEGRRTVYNQDHLPAKAYIYLEGYSRRSSTVIEPLKMIVLAATSVLFIAIALAGPASAQTTLAYNQPAEKPGIDLYALMSGTCSKLKVDGHDFPCKTVAFFHSEKGRAQFTAALEDPADENHIIAFSGINGHRSRVKQDIYELPVDRMLLNSKRRPKVDGIPVPSTEASQGVCRQIGSFAALKIASISCSATDEAGRTYELEFVSDGKPITLRRILESSASSPQNVYP